MPEDLAPAEFVRQYCIKSLVCCFSGGKDSLATTHYVMNALEEVDIDKHVLFVDTTVMIPIAEPYVRDTCTRFGWHLTVVRPEVDFFTQARTKGMPHVHRRWCCYALKLKPIFDFVRQLQPQRGEVTGLREDESLRRQALGLTYVWHDTRRGMNAWHYKPILKWTEKDVLAYIKKHDLPMPPQYRLGLKETCMCGAFSSPRQIMILKALYPDLFKKFVELEGAFKHDWACFWDKRPVYARELAKQKTIVEAVNHEHE